MADKNSGASGRQGKKIVDSYSGGADNREQVDKIKDLYRQFDIRGGIRMGDNGKAKMSRRAYEALVNTSRDVLQNTKFTDDSTAGEYKALREFVRTTPVKLSTTDKSSIADYGAYIKQNFGGVKVSNKGISMDSFFQELSSMFPQHFNSANTTNPADQMQKVNEALSKLKPKTYNLTKQQVESYLHTMVNDIAQGYFLR